MLACIYRALARNPMFRGARQLQRTLASSTQVPDPNIRVRSTGAA